MIPFSPFPYVSRGGVGAVVVSDNVDYSSIIRSEIERDVAGLIAQLGHQVAYWKSLDWLIANREQKIKPHGIELGYTINMHRGKDLYKEGDMIAGLPIVISRSNPRSITVVADNIELVSEGFHNAGDLDDEDEPYEEEGYHDIYTTKDLSQTITW